MGQAMFRGQCMNCHTVDGYRAMKRLLANNGRDAIEAKLKMLHDYKPDSPYHAYMPALVGTKDEIKALGDYLATLVPQPTTNATAQTQPATALAQTGAPGR